MAKDSLREELVEADVLCVGGGIAGLMAAIRASELGAKVVVAEKEMFCSFQQIMQDYAGLVRSETLLTAGLS